MPRSRRGDTAETNNFSVWPNDDIRTVTIITMSYIVNRKVWASSCLLVFKFIMALQNTPNITFRMPTNHNIYQYFVIGQGLSN